MCLEVRALGVDLVAARVAALVKLLTRVAVSLLLFLGGNGRRFLGDQLR